MGRHMQATSALFFDGGRGHLTEAGHAFFAQAIFDCFYAGPAATGAAQGCVSEGN